MKKLVTMFLAVALCMGLAVPAMAASTETVNGVTITNVVRQEAKNVTFMDSEYVEENGEWHMKKFPVDKEITVYYVAGSTTISVSTGDSLPGESAYMLEDGVYVQCGGGAASWGWDSTPMYGEDEVNVIYAVVAGIPTDNGYDYTEALYYAFDNGATPSEPVEPEAPVEPSEPTAPTEPTTPVEQEQPAGTVTYTVKKGDTMGFIATNYYGNNAQHKALYNANIEAFKATNGKLVPGMALTIPETLGGVKRIAAPVLAEGETLYTVKAGDTLSGIAQSVYGDMWQYKAIFERNTDRLKNANSIYEGQVIVLPAK